MDLLLLYEKKRLRCYSARFADLLFVGRGVGIEVGPVGAFVGEFVGAVGTFVGEGVGPVGFCVVGIALPDFPITAAGGGVGA